MLYEEELQTRSLMSSFCIVSFVYVKNGQIFFADLSSNLCGPAANSLIVNCSSASMQSIAVLL